MPSKVKNTGSIGKAITRKDGPQKVQGQATYAAEHQLEGLLHAVLLTAPIASGHIKSVDIAKAEALSGVQLVMTHQHHSPKLSGVKAYPYGPAGTALIPLQNNKIVQRGQIVAVVVADSLEVAQQAVELIETEYDVDGAVGTLSMDAPLLSHHLQVPQLGHKRGDPNGALAEAEVKFSATYTTRTQNHNPMELHAAVAHWEGEGDAETLHFYDTTQWLQSPQTALAKYFELQPEQVHVISPFVGGGFGCKANTWNHAPLVAAAARQLRRPVKVELSREQMFNIVGLRPETEQRYELGAHPDGTISALKLHGFTQTSMTDLFPEQVGTIPKMLYAVPNMQYTHTMIRSNVVGPNPMRAPGEATGSFGLECAMDELAELTGLDPLEFRLKNYAETDPEHDLPYSSKGLRDCYRVAGEKFGWERRSPEPKSMRDGHELIGYGMASGAYPVYASPASALVRLCAGGSAEVEAGTHDLGTGTYTVLAQIAADALGLPVERVKVKLGDSRFPKNAYSGGSRTTLSVGPAVQAAAYGARQTLLDALPEGANPFAGVSPTDLEFRDGRVFAPDQPQGVSLDELIAKTGRQQLEAYREMVPSGGDEKMLSKMKSGKEASVEAANQRYARYNFAAHFVEVRVDEDLRTVRLERIISAFDIGRVMNAKTARSQLIGGMVWGASMGLMEQTITDPSSKLVLNADLAEYWVPVNADIRGFEAYSVGVPDPHISALGAKGAGEIGIVGVAAAIANAVYHATGVRIRDLPISLDKLL